MIAPNQFHLIFQRLFPPNCFTAKSPRPPKLRGTSAGFTISGGNRRQTAKFDFLTAVERTSSFKTFETFPYSRVQNYVHNYDNYRHKGKICNCNWSYPQICQSHHTKWPSAEMLANSAPSLLYKFIKLSYLKTILFPNSHFELYPWKKMSDFFKSSTIELLRANGLLH